MLKKFLEKYGDNVIVTFILISVRIIMLIGFLYFIYFLGYKGIIGITIGMVGMAYFILSGNPLLMFFLSLFGDKEEQKNIVKMFRGEK